MDNKTCYLSHHGIMGMKWGVWNDETRARRTGSGKRRPTSERQARKDREKDRKHAMKNASLLSDKELDRRIKRLEKEKRLKELSEASLTPGKKMANEILTQNGKKVIGIAVGMVATAVVADQLAKRGLGKEKKNK